MYSVAPGVRANILGRNLLPAILTPVAVQNNPAGLGFLRDAQFQISSDGVFRFNFMGVQDFVAGLGNLGASLTEYNLGMVAPADTITQRLRRGTIALARNPGAGFSLGGAVHYNEIGEDNFFSLSLGALLLFDRSGSTPARLANHTPFNDPLIPFRSGISISVQDLPLSRRRLQTFGDLSAFYRFTGRGPVLSMAVQATDKDAIWQSGLGFQVADRLGLFAGIQDFDVKKARVGASVLASQQSIDIAYDFSGKRIFVDFAVRLGPSPRERAAFHRKKSIHYARSGLYEKALREVHHYLSFGVSDTATTRLLKWLNEKVETQRAAVAELLREAQKYESKRWFISATLNYLKVLEKDPDNRQAKRRLEVIRPMVDIYINQLYRRGVQAFEEGRYEQARRAFQAVLSVRRNHPEVQTYLARVDSFFAKQSQEMFLRGLGFYSQKNFAMAIRSFEKALEYDHANEEARSYLARTREEYRHRSQVCDSLITQAKSLQSQKDYVAAYNLYEQALEIDPFRDEVQKAMRKLKPVLQRYVDGFVRQGKKAFQRGDLEEARSAFRNALKIDPGRSDARRFLARIEKEGRQRIDAKFQEGKRYYEAGQWSRAIDALEEVLSMDRNHKQARKLLREAYAQSSFEERLAQAERKYRQGNYLEAMDLFAQLLERDSSNVHIKQRLEDCQRQLSRLVEQYFNQGISYYTAERYRDAIREWDKALKINPNHTQALAYKKKAQQRLDALRKLQ